MIAFGTDERVCPVCRCRIAAYVLLTEDGRLIVKRLHESSKNERCRRCCEACGFVRRLAKMNSFVLAAKLDPVQLAVQTGLSVTSLRTILGALHSAMLEAVFDYQDQFERAAQQATA